MNKSFTKFIIFIFILFSFTACKAKVHENSPDLTDTAQEGSIETKEDGKVEEENTQKPNLFPKESSFELVEVSDEIKNSTVADEIVQVGNIVLPNDCSLTVKEVLDLLSKDYPVELDQSDVEHIHNKAPEGLKHYGISVHRTDMEDGPAHSNVVCCLEIQNISDADEDIMNYVVKDIYSTWLPGCLNFFYPGNICDVCTVHSVEELREFEENEGLSYLKDCIEKRIEENVFLNSNYEDAVLYIEELAEKAGTEAYWDEEKNDYRIVIKGSGPFEWDRDNYKYSTLVFTFDKENKPYFMKRYNTFTIKD